IFPVVLSGLCVLLLGPTLGSGGRILVAPVDGSHWINMEILLRKLHARGHNITVLRSTKSWYIPSDSSFYTSINVTMLEDQTDKSYYNKLLLDVIECRRSGQFLRSFCQQHLITSMFNKGHKILANSASAMLDNLKFMKKLRDAKFDLMLTDPALTIGLILGSYLKLPMVFNVRWINTGESHFTMAPSPVSYVPVPNSELHDRMDFLGRFKNMLLYLHSVVEQHLIINPAYSELFQKHFPPGTDLLSLQLAADIWLVRVDFVFEFPRPTMPNMVYIGGFQCQEAQPLPAELEAFMRSSGEHGVVVMSLGTIVSALPREVTEAMASAFAELPQKVVWKFVGEKPSSLGNNTMLTKWMPQNDILGHPKTRAFVAHGGTNGMYEAIYHGVPVLGLPLLFDQFDNLHRLKIRGAARVVEAKSLTKEDFLLALKDVLENPSYRSNIKHLSRLHRDQLTSPMDTAVFWTEYVIRNKGAAHLRAAGFTLPWYTYHSLDVAAVATAVIGACVWVVVFICRVLYRRMSRRKAKSD
uniref:UDP-glucuronosyltransferase n=2 Tax=Tetraodon nigroviridis TaxID=99883 RepID=H3DNR6_TETNG